MVVLTIVIIVITVMVIRSLRYRPSPCSNGGSRFDADMVNTSASGDAENGANGDNGDCDGNKIATFLTYDGRRFEVDLVYASVEFDADLAGR